MKFSLSLSNSRAQEIIDAIGNAGLLKIFDATDTLLITLVCGSPFAAAPSNGVITANAISTPNTAVAAGTASYAQICTSAGTVVVDELSVGTSGTNVVLGSTTIAEAGSVVINSCTITEQNIITA
jgi:hypothetical protein